MCGRIFQTLNPDQLIRLAGTTLIRNGDRYSTNYNVCPTTNIPVVRHNAGGNNGNYRCLDMMKWGYNAPFGQLIINARCEELQDKRTFVPMLNTSRCVILAEGYYEWTPKKEPYAFRPNSYKDNNKDSEKPPCLFIAALYAKDESVILLTRESMGDASQVHTRMPVLLDESEIEMWIDSDKYKFESIIDKYILNEKADKWKSLTQYRIGPYVHDIHNKTEQCLMTLDEHKQKLDETGIKRFFQKAEKKSEEKKIDSQEKKESAKVNTEKVKDIPKDTPKGTPKESEQPTVDDEKKAALAAYGGDWKIVVTNESDKKPSSVHKDIDEKNLKRKIQDRGFDTASDLKKKTKTDSNSKGKGSHSMVQVSLDQMLKASK